MNRDTRPPSRVSKACDRCRGQKKRCDFVRPCQHCLYSQTECVTTNAASIARKSRLRSEGRTGRPASSPANISPDQTEMRWDQTSRQHDDQRERGSLDQRSPQRLDQRERGNSSLPGFEADSALAITRKIFRSQQTPAFKDRATSAIPGGGRRHGTNSSNSVPSPLIPVVDIIGVSLPSFEVCNKLLETYFSDVHWFSLVVYEPKFRARYNAVVGSSLASRSDHGFLLLLLMILIMGCWYTLKDKNKEIDLSPTEIESLRNRLLKVVQRDFMDLMDEDCLEFVQLCALLGSFYLYHGRPRSSFSILGAATKTSQAMDLHRNSEMRHSFEDKEERNRVWWTIYTWDRFASITYGRPLGINDKDCNVLMPSEIFENVHFDPQFEATKICLSEYQCRLNLIYRIASPLLEDIYGIRASNDIDPNSQLPEMVATANQGLLEWQQDLPRHLSFDYLDDITPHSSAEQKAHSLQALSLQLTYDNLMIVLHRPLLAGRAPVESSAAIQAMSPTSQISDDVRDIGFRRCLSSALRISNIQRKPNLFSLARTTHLVSFLGMNLFTASVVLFICAWSDTLSDTAQEAKRGLRRMLQMQKALSNHASLSFQCGSILEDLVQLILKREMEEMLVDRSTSDEITTDGPANRKRDPNPSELQGQVLSHGPGTESTVYTDFDINGGEAAPPENSHFKQSLMTLQRVFHDSSQFRQQVVADGRDGLSTTRQDYGDFVPTANASNSGVMGNSQDFDFNSGTFTGVEDLGQFWLWDADNFNF